MDRGAAVVAALLADGSAALGRFWWEGPYLPELLAQQLFALVPVWAFTPLFRLLGYNAKYYAFAGIVVAEITGLALAGLVARRAFGRARRAGWSGGALWALATGCLAVAVLVVVLPLLDAGLAGGAVPAGAAVSVPTTTATVALYVAILLQGARA